MNEIEEFNDCPVGVCGMRFATERPYHGSKQCRKYICPDCNVHFYSGTTKSSMSATAWIDQNEKQQIKIKRFRIKEDVRI